MRIVACGVYGGGVYGGRNRMIVQQLPLRTADTPLYSAALRSSRIPFSVCRAIESA
jgi:hypothetical protein